MQPSISVSSIIVGQASKEDIVLAKERELQGNQALKVVKERVEFHKLAMQVLSASITLDGSRIVIEFYAEQRVDFRALVHADFIIFFHKRKSFCSLGFAVCKLTPRIFFASSM